MISHETSTSTDSIDAMVVEPARWEKRARAAKKKSSLLCDALGAWPFSVDVPNGGAWWGFNRRIVHLKSWCLQSRPLEIVFCRVGYSPRPLARLIGGLTVLWLSLHMGRVAERMVMPLCRAECEDALKMGLVFSP